MKKVSATTREKNKKRRLAKATSYTKLFVEDLKEVLKLCHANKATPAETLRDIVSDWVRGEKIKAMGRSEIDPQVRTIYERVLLEQIAPLADNISQIKKALADMNTHQPAAASVLNESQSESKQEKVLEAIDELRVLMEHTDSKLSKSAASQINQLDYLTLAQKALQGICCETYASTWTATDFIVRYLVEAALRGENSDLAENEAEVLRDRIGLRLEGLRKIAEVEVLYDLPDEFQLARQILPQYISPLVVNKEDQVDTLF